LIALCLPKLELGEGEKKIVDYIAPSQAGAWGRRDVRNYVEQKVY
jgi:hypothetical protein